MKPYPCLCPYCGKLYRSPIHPPLRRGGKREGKHLRGRLVCPCAACCRARHGFRGRQFAVLKRRLGK